MPVFHTLLDARLEFGRDIESSSCCGITRPLHAPGLLQLQLVFIFMYILFTAVFNFQQSALLSTVVK